MAHPACESDPDPGAPPATPGDASDLVAQLAERVATEIDPAQVLRLVAQAIGGTLGVSRVIYGEVDLRGEAFHVLLDWTDGVESLEGKHLLHADSAIVQHYLAGRILIADDRQRIAFSEREEQALRETGSGYFIAVPLLHENRLSAIFSVSDHRPRVWSEAEVAIVASTGPLIWRALDHHRLLRSAGPAVARARPAATPTGTLWIADGRRQLGIPASDVERIEAVKDYAIIHMMNGARHMIRQRMSALEKLLDPEVVLRISRSAFVAAAAVRTLETQGGQSILILRSGTILRVGPLYLERVAARFGRP